MEVRAWAVEGACQESPASDTPVSCGSQALLSVFLIVIFLLPVVGVVLRLIRIARRRRAERERRPPS